MLVGGYLGFGALAAAGGIPLPIAVGSTLFIWALPGQLVLVEMHGLGAPFVATVIAVMLSSARFLPMTVMLLPELRDPRHAPWKYYALAQILSLSGWSMAVVRFPHVPRARRLAWLSGFAVTLMAVCAVSTAFGYVGADRLPSLVKLSLVFMVPAYYLLILLGAARERVAALGLACGALTGPLAYLATPDWSVVLGGLCGGTLAYACLRLWAPRA